MAVATLATSFGLRGARDIQASQKTGDGNSRFPTPGLPSTTITQTPQNEGNNYIFKGWNKETRELRQNNLFKLPVFDLQPEGVSALKQQVGEPQESTNFASWLRISRSSNGYLAFDGSQNIFAQDLEDLQVVNYTLDNQTVQNIYNTLPSGEDLYLALAVNDQTVAVSLAQAHFDQDGNFTTDHIFGANTSEAQELVLAQDEEESMVIIKDVNDPHAVLLAAHGIYVGVGDAILIGKKGTADGGYEIKSILMDGTTKRVLVRGEQLPSGMEGIVEPLPTQVPLIVAAAPENISSLSPEAIVLSEAQFTPDAMLASADGKYTTMYSAAVLESAGLSGISAPADATSRAHEITVNAIYEKIGLPVGSEVTFQGYRLIGGEAEFKGTNTITGVIDSIVQYTVTSSEFSSIKSDLESQNIEFIEFTPLGGNNQVSGIAFWGADGTMTIVSRPIRLQQRRESKMAQDIIFDGPAIAHVMLVSTAAYGHGVLRTGPLPDANQIYEIAYGCTRAAGCSVSSISYW